MSKEDFHKGNLGDSEAGMSPDYDVAWNRMRQELGQRKRRQIQRRTLGMGVCGVLALMLLIRLFPPGHGKPDSLLVGTQPEKILPKSTEEAHLESHVQEPVVEVVRSGKPFKIGGVESGDSGEREIRIRVVQSKASELMRVRSTGPFRDLGKVNSGGLLVVRHSEKGGVRFLDMEGFLDRFRGDPIIYFPNSPHRLVWMGSGASDSRWGIHEGVERLR